MLCVVRGASVCAVVHVQPARDGSLRLMYQAPPHAQCPVAQQVVAQGQDPSWKWHTSCICHGMRNSDDNFDHAAANDPSRLFASLGFGFVHRFLWLVLATCVLAVSGILLLGWMLEGDVTVQAAGVVRPTSRHLVKSAIDGRLQKVCVAAGDHVATDDILFVLAPHDLHTRQAQIEGQLALSDSRSARLRGQIDHDRRVLTAVLASRRLEVERAAFALAHIRREQQLYTDHARNGWHRLDLESLVPVRESRSILQQAEAQAEVTLRQLEANEARITDLQLERQTWIQLDAERRAVWQQLESAVIRAPVAGVVLTDDLEHRTGDRVQAGQALLELAEDDAWTARVLIGQIDRPKVRPGQRVRVFIEAYPHLEYGVLEGRVERIAEQVSTNGPGYLTDVALDDPAISLADGMAAEVRVSVDSGRLLYLVWHRLLRQLGGTHVPDVREART